ncbi:YiiX/YebB-like N1pC/P60 family cysteine hydrolase [Nitrincola sp.]|uniref:YiiX/YebB-like N1pC/P60 family cysteine hydrolase n=1 Tax=Nitrincola sp. TaxID=1926584 RepID=UPI003A946930
MKFLLDISQLEHGDIILESGNTKLISGAIKKATDSEYSHAMVYTGYSMIHATTKGGVFSKNPQRLLVDKSKALKVLRLRGGLTQPQKAAVCGEAGALVGSLYGKREALGAIRKKKRNEAQNRRQFCSRLVAQCYDKAGIKLVKNVDYCAPEDFNTSSMLYEVTSAVREASAQDIALMGKEDPNLVNQKETFKWLNKARNALKKNGIEIQTINDVIKALLVDGRHDKTICKFVNATKYLTLYNIDRDANPHRYSASIFAAEAINSQDFHSFIRDEVTLNEREISRHSFNLQACRTNYEPSNLEFILLHIELYCNLLQETRYRLVVITTALKAIGYNTDHVNSLIARIDDTILERN